MALRTIVQDGDPILKKVCRPVVKFDDRLGVLLDDMKETLLDAKVYLQTWVKVKENWRDSMSLLRNFGFTEQ